MLKNSLPSKADDHEIVVFEIDIQNRREQPLAVYNALTMNSRSNSGMAI